MQQLDFMVVPELHELHQSTGSALQLWTTLQQLLKGPTETQCVREAIGETLLQQIDTATLELTSLAGILADLRREGESPCRSPPIGSGQRDILRERLRLLLDRTTIPLGEVIHSARDRRILEYVRPSSSQRPFTASTRSIDSRPTTASHSSRSCSHVDPMAQLAPLSKSLRFDKVHEISAELRGLFQHELSLTLQDIDQLRNLIDDETKRRSVAPEPSVTDLREFLQRVSTAQDDVDHVQRIASLPKTKNTLPSLRK